MVLQRVPKRSAPVTPEDNVIERIQRSQQLVVDIPRVRAVLPVQIKAAPAKQAQSLPEAADQPESESSDESDSEMQISNADQPTSDAAPDADPLSLLSATNKEHFRDNCAQLVMAIERIARSEAFRFSTQHADTATDDMVAAHETSLRQRLLDRVMQAAQQRWSDN
mgnify:CR=1 FL=1